VAEWVTVVGDVEEIERLSSYQAVLSDSFGPFNLNADVAVEVIELDEGRSIRFKGAGKDRSVGTSISVDARMALEPDGSGTLIDVAGSWNVIGTVATMGGGTIRKKADAIVDEFFETAEAELG
jgi:carbon monoxide dehydrogenase subunit G